MAFKDEVGSLDRIASAVETISGGKEIPTPTQSDKDKVLSVNAQGKYALATPSGGGSLVVPVFTVDAEENITCDMTYEEICAAVSAGKCSHCLSKTFEDGDYVWDTLTLFDSWEGSVKFSATRLNVNPNIDPFIAQGIITVTEEEITIDFQRVPIPSE